jgi:hypothetical protein
VGRVEDIEAVLLEAEAAHGTYESTVLHGVYDQEWPSWYAAYAFEHGIDAIVGRAMGADELAALLTTGWSDYQREHPDRAEPWAPYIATRIAAEA